MPYNYDYVYITENHNRKRVHLTMDITGHSGRSVMSACRHNGAIKVLRTLWNDGHNGT